MAEVVVRKHKYKHEFQDKEYGIGMRVMNVSRDGRSATCTVCGEKVNLK